MEQEFNKSSIAKLVLKLGIPSMLAQFFNILYSIVDRIFIGNLPKTGSLSLASIGICAPAITAITGFATMTGIGGAALFSISMGKKDKKTAQKAINNAFLMLIVISIVVMISIFVFKKPLLYLLGCSDLMYPFADSYLTIYTFGTFAALCSLGMNQFILAQGFAKRGMISIIVGAVCNVILDPVFIYGFKLGISGAAIATVISQVLSMMYVLWTLRKKNIPVRLELGAYSVKAVQRILRIGIMPFIITIMDNMILIVMNMQLRKYGGTIQGDTYIACAAIVQSFMVIVNCPAQGITGGCGTLFGFFYGAGNYKKVMQTFKYVFLMCFVYMGILLVMSQTCITPFVSLFTNDLENIKLAVSFISKYTMGLLGVAVQCAFVDGVTAMGKVGYALPMSLFRKMMFLVGIFILPLITSLENIFYVGTISDIMGSLFTIIVFLTIICRKLKLEMNVANRQLHEV